MKLRRIFSTAIWLITAICAAVLWWHSESSIGPIVGLVEAPRHAVGALEAGRVSELYVRAGDTVTAGQVIGRLDTSDIDAAMSIARSQLGYALASIETAAAEHSGNLRAERARALSDLAKAKASIAEARSLRAARKAEISALEQSSARLDQAVALGVARADQLSDLKARAANLRQLSATSTSEAAWEALAQDLDVLLGQLGQDDGDAALAALRANVKIETARLEELEARRDARKLIAPVDGRVEALLKQAGDTVAAGEPLIWLNEVQARRILAYVPEVQARALEVGAAVSLASRDRRAQPAMGTVEALGAGIVELPPRLWPNANQPLYGRAIFVRLSRENGLLPGEAVQLWPSTEGALAAESAPDGRWQALAIPEALALRSRLEPSGALWVPEWDRFLVVSDDTGLAGSDDHPAWVFKVSRDGRFEPEPLVIEGFEGELSDLEAVTQVGDTVFLLCSQSLSKKGKRPKARQWLISAKLDGPRLVATGRVALFEALAELPFELRTSLGVDDPGLDIEAMTAVDGALLFGLKTPIKGAAARLWKLTSPLLLVSEGRFSPNGARMQPAGSVKLPTGPQGEPGGFSELLNDEGALFALSTLPDGPKNGAAWRLQVTDAGAEATLLERFPGVAPEGLAVGPSGKMLFLDEGEAPPRWGRLP